MHSNWFAIPGSALLHIGLAAWLFAPSPPAAIPQQQIIMVSVVSPSQIKQETEQQKVEVERVAVLPPKPTGIRKISPEPTVKPKQAETKKQKKQVMATRLTTGIISPDAKATQSAVTKPIAASYLNNPAPSYPEKARKLRQQGTVLLNVRVQADGNPKVVHITQSSGYNILDKMALETVRRWKFLPARRGGKAVEGNVEVPIVFQISG